MNNNPTDQRLLALMADAPTQNHPLYWHAFWELRDEAVGEMGPRAIKRSEALADAQSYGLTMLEQEAFVAIIRAMDYVYFEIEHEKKDKASKRP